MGVREVGEVVGTGAQSRQHIDSHFAAFRLTLLICLFVWLLLTMWWLWPRSASGLDPKARPLAIAAPATRLPDEETNIQIYEHTSKSVVQVTSMAVESDFYGLNEQRVPKGVGSGFVWDTEGHIVTNYHVVEGADGARVTLADHSTYDARQIWADPEQDIAVLWIDGGKKTFHPVALGTSHDLSVGQIVYALGDPFGLDQTMTTGIVSALGREIEGSNGRRVHGVIQTSAAINPGNSGGPLFDRGGRLIGMNTAILSPSGAFAGIGFAIPVDEINHIAPQLIRNGKVVRPRLGVQVADDQMARQLGVEQGALIVKVIPNSPAAKAGLKETRRSSAGQIELGDVIVAINGKQITNADDLRSVLGELQIGSTATLSILRDGRTQDVPVILTPQQSGQ